MTIIDQQANSFKALRRWLYATAFLVFIMVILGGATRLTGSGLSITEWKPIMGALPPLNEQDWLAAFAKYQQIPQYKILNAGMALSDFKFIFWWEWAHRFLGRLIGVVFFVPLLWFGLRGRIPRQVWASLLVILALGAAQGGLGWFMVYSGLSDRVDVSQYRLSAHLTLAAVIFSALIWVALGLGRPRHKLRTGGDRGALLLVLLVLLQIAAGAFVAGLDAGMGYNTWPKMDGAWIPAGLWAMSPWWRNVFENAMTVQFLHRMIAYLVLVAAAIYAWRRFSLSGLMLVYVVFAQITIGILTLLLHVLLPVALLHQATAFLVLATAVWNLHRQLLVADESPLGLGAQTA